MFCISIGSSGMALDDKVRTAVEFRMGARTPMNSIISIISITSSVSSVSSTSSTRISVDMCRGNGSSYNMGVMHVSDMAITCSSSVTKNVMVWLCVCWIACCLLAQQGPNKTFTHAQRTDPKHRAVAI